MTHYIISDHATLLSICCYGKLLLMYIFNPATQGLLSQQYQLESVKNVFKQEWAASYWVKGGMPKYKLVIGIPAYGKGFTLEDGNNHGIGALTVGNSLPGKYTKESGTLAYYEVSLHRGERYTGLL